MASALDMVAGAGQYSFDPLGNIYEGRKTRFATDEMNRADQARPLMGQALQGDSNALNSLAGVDPQGFMDVSGFQDKRAKSKAEQAAAAAERVAAALYRADTPEKWAATIDYLKKSDYDVGPDEEDFANRDAVLSEYMTLKEQMDQGNADRTAGIQQQNADTARLNAGGGAGKPPSGYRVTENGLEPIPGGPADPNKPIPVKSLRPTTDQNNAAGFYDRLTEAEKVLDDPAVVNAAIDFKGKALANAPFGIGNYLATPEYQKFDQATRNFVNAVLRKESGAAISQSEFDNAKVQYFPQPGDSPEKLAQKAENRTTVINAMKRTAAGALTQGQQVVQPAPQTAAPITEQELPQAMQDAQDAIAQGADPQAVIDELINSGVDPDFAGTLLNGQ